MRDEMMDVTQLVVPAQTEPRADARLAKPDTARGGFGEALAGAENLHDRAADRARQVRSERADGASPRNERADRSESTDDASEARPADDADAAAAGEAEAGEKPAEGDQHTDTGDAAPGEIPGEGMAEAPEGEAAAVPVHGTALAAQVAAAAQTAPVDGEPAGAATVGKAGEASVAAAQKPQGQVAGMQPEAAAAGEADAEQNTRPVEVRPTAPNANGTDAENAEVDPAGDTRLRQTSAANAKSDGTAGPASTRSGSTSGDAATPAADKAADTAAAAAAARPAGPQGPAKATQAEAGTEATPDAARTPGSSTTPQAPTTGQGAGQQQETAGEQIPQQQQPAEPAKAAQSGSQRAANTPQPAQTQAQPMHATATALDGHGMQPQAGSDAMSAAERLGLQTVRDLGRTGMPQSRLEHIAEQLAARLRLSQAAGGSQVHLTMRPRELGDVQVQLAVKDGTLAAVVTADRAETGRMLQQDSAELRRMLEGLGLKVDQLDVHVRDNGAQAGTDSGVANRQDAAPAFRSIRGGADTTVDGLNVASDGAVASEPQPDEVHDGDVSLLA